MKSVLLILISCLCAPSFGMDVFMAQCSTKLGSERHEARDDLSVLSFKEKAILMAIASAYPGPFTPVYSAVPVEYRSLSEFKLIQLHVKSGGSSSDKFGTVTLTPRGLGVAAEIARQFLSLEPVKKAVADRKTRLVRILKFFKRD